MIKLTPEEIKHRASNKLCAICGKKLETEKIQVFDRLCDNCVRGKTDIVQTWAKYHRNLNYGNPGYAMLESTYGYYPLIQEYYCHQK